MKNVLSAKIVNKREGAIIKTNLEKYKYFWGGKFVSINELPEIARQFFPTLDMYDKQILCDECKNCKKSGCLGCEHR